MIPDDLHYTKEHEWLRVEDGDDGGTATVGITHHAQEELGDIVYVELPAPGATFEAGDAIGSVESVKAVSEIFCPVAGEVTEVNATLEAAPERVNQDPYDEGWFLKVKIKDPATLETLLSASDYATYLSEESS